MFADLVDVKIDKTQLDDLVEKGAPPEARGAFGAVYKRVLRTKVSTLYTVMGNSCMLAMKYLFDLGSQHLLG